MRGVQFSLDLFVCNKPLTNMFKTGEQTLDFVQVCAIFKMVKKWQIDFYLIFNDTLSYMPLWEKSARTFSYFISLSAQRAKKHTLSFIFYLDNLPRAGETKKNISSLIQGALSLPSPQTVMLLLLISIIPKEKFSFL